MIQQHLDYYLSAPRLYFYLKASNNDADRAIHLYKLNIKISESFYPVLSVIEVCLRNTIHENFKRYFNNEYWFRDNLPDDFTPIVKEAFEKILSQNKKINPDCIVAELNLGFWNRLFSKKYSRILWKPLRLIFTNLPKHLRQRQTVANKLYNIRIIRNRIYHYEPIIGDITNIEIQYKSMITFLHWIDGRLPSLIKDIDRFNTIFSEGNYPLS
ncbi:MAG: hypothetical protein ACK55K_03840 [Bacteroidota bacterium]